MLVNNSPKTKEEKIVNLAKQFGFEVDFYREKTSLVRFKRDEDTDEYVRVDVWYNTGTVGIYSKQFKDTQGARYTYNVSMEDLAEVFSDPYNKQYKLLP